MKNRFLLLVLLFFVCVVVLLVYLNFVDKQKIKNDSLQTLSLVEERSEYVENYLSYGNNSKDKNSIIAVLGKEEYRFFVERMNEKK